MDRARFLFGEIRKEDDSPAPLVETGKTSKVIVAEFKGLKADLLLIVSAGFKPDINENSPGEVTLFR